MANVVKAVLLITLLAGAEARGAQQNVQLGKHVAEQTLKNFPEQAKRIAEGAEVQRISKKMQGPDSHLQQLANGTAKQAHPEFLERASNITAHMLAKHVAEQTLKNFPEQAQRIVEGTEAMNAEPGSKEQVQRFSKTIQLPTGNYRHLQQLAKGTAEQVNGTRRMQAIQAITTLALGYSHSCAIAQADNTLSCWGYNQHGETNVPSSIGAVSSVFAGGYHNCAIAQADNTLSCWGANQHGQTNVPSSIGAVSSVSAGYYHNCAIAQADNTLSCWGHNQYGQTNVPSSIGAVSYVAAGCYHTCAIAQADNTLSCWGRNGDGQTNVPSSIGAVSYVAAGCYHTCAIAQADNTLSCWGRNDHGQTNVPAAVQFPALPSSTTSTTSATSTTTTTTTTTMTYTITTDTSTTDTSTTVTSTTTASTTTLCVDLSGEYFYSGGGTDNVLVVQQEGCSGRIFGPFSYIEPLAYSTDGLQVNMSDGITGTCRTASSGYIVEWSSGVIYSPFSSGPEPTPAPSPGSTPAPPSPTPPLECTRLPGVAENWVQKCLDRCDGEGPCDSRCANKCTLGCMCNAAPEPEQTQAPTPAPICEAQAWVVSGQWLTLCPRRCDGDTCHHKCDQKCTNSCRCNAARRLSDDGSAGIQGRRQTTAEDAMVVAIGKLEEQMGHFKASHDMQAASHGKLEEEIALLRASHEQQLQAMGQMMAMIQGLVGYKAVSTAKSTDSDPVNKQLV